MKGLRCYILGAFVVCACHPAFSQNSAACQADLQNLRVPPRAFIDGVLLESDPPVSLLFSRDGIDVYSAVDYGEIQLLRFNGMAPSDETVTIISVFQDEKARSSAVGWLEARKVSPENAQKVKFEVLQLMLTPIWVDDTLERKWMISGYELYGPYSCVPPDQRRESEAQYDSQLCAATDFCPNEIYGLLPLGGLPPEMRVVPEGPNVLKALAMIRSKLAAYGLPN
ncbi:MAG: hypothetical protein ACYC46_03335 [Acidobacteriaceae bacterium]